MPDHAPGGRALQTGHRPLASRAEEQKAHRSTTPTHPGVHSCVFTPKIPTSITASSVLVA